MRKRSAAVVSAAFLLVAPGTFVVLIPWWITRWRLLDPLPAMVMPTVRVLGALLALAGVAVLVYSFVRFVVEGLGTPIPAAPPTRLVVGGLYRYVRNPMYVGIYTAIIGEALLFGQPSLLLYVACLMGPAFAFVHWREEPSLARTFGADYERYRAAVPGWWPRLRPYRPEL